LKFKHVQHPRNARGKLPPQLVLRKCNTDHYTELHWYNICAGQKRENCRAGGGRNETAITAGQEGEGMRQR